MFLNKVKKKMNQIFRNLDKMFKIKNKTINIY